MSHDLVTRIPFAFARSALFRPAEVEGSVFRQAIPAAEDYAISVEYSGPVLTTTHALVWQALVAFAHLDEKGTATTLEVRLVDVLRACGRKSMQTNAKRWLRRQLDDLVKANVEATTPLQSFDGPLIKKYTEPKNGVIWVEFSPKLAAFLSNEVVLVPIHKKALLIAHPLAAWMSDYLATHKDCYRVTMQTLHRLTGSTLALRVFRRRMTYALDSILPRHTLKRYRRDKDLVTLHKEKTRVVLLRPEAAAAKKISATVDSRAQAARMQRIKVAL